jgi:uncharacterized repeat protein (TIGR03987 family)
MLLFAIIFINLALIFYTVGVLGEKKQRKLKKWHLYVFWAGLVFDTLGTTLMSKLANDEFSFNLHSITGLLAILLMFFHVLWASYVLAKNNEKLKINFHKFSLVVWMIWLIPFISGAVFGMGK